MPMTADAAVSSDRQAICSNTQENVSFDIFYDTPQRALLTITIPHFIVSLFFDAAAQTQQKQIKAPGFGYGQAPLEFLKQNYQSSLIDHVKEFLFKYCIINIMYRIIREQVLVVAGDPRIIDMIVRPEQDAKFILECTIVDHIVINEWRYFPFRAPKRKNYKDLDRQVEHFIIEEAALQAKMHNNGIRENDWVALNIERTHEEGTPLIPDFAQIFWLQISDEQVDNPLRELLLGQHVGFSIITQNKGLQDYFSEQVATDYWYAITVIRIVPYAYFCFEQFKHHFRIKTKKELLKKLIEVFSYRNDISQRRATAEECLKLLLNKHPFEIPLFVRTRFQENILRGIHDSPDYNVYRTQKEFISLLQELATKAAKESMLIDSLAYHEVIDVSQDDVCYYLNFTKRGRTKEFIYFDLPVHTAEGQTTLIAEEELMRYCLREKALNHVVYHLTKE
jgi:FKBP-type peptidyl-prolyl cis-trans isomerase (trigger factor)